MAMAPPLLIESQWPIVDRSKIQLFSLNTPNGIKVALALEELQIPYEAHTVNIGKGEQFSDAFKSISPNSKIPAIVDLVKGGGPAWPRLETDTHLMSIGSGRPLEEAWRASQVDMIAWMGELYGLDRLDAYQLLTQISQVPIANVVDPNYSAVTKIDKRLLPSAAAYGGIHGELRSAAASLGTISY